MMPETPAGTGQAQLLTPQKHMPYGFRQQQDIQLTISALLPIRCAASKTNDITGNNLNSL